MYYRITTHAVQRFRERDGTCDKSDDEDIRALLGAEIQRGIPYGYQSGADRLFLLPCGLIAAVTPSNGQFAVKTILTREQAIANMQSRRRPLCKPATRRSKRREALRAYLADRDDELRLLAEEHFQKATGHAARYRDLGARGFNTSRLALKRYDEIYKEVRAEFYAQRRDHSRSRADAA